MWTWTAILVLALVVQSSWGVPTFGTGPQQEWWNEVDDEFPGEIRQFDDVRPLSDLDDITDEKELSTDQKRSTPSITPISSTVEPLPAPTPTPRPPTVSERPEEESSNNSELKRAKENSDHLESFSPTQVPSAPLMATPTEETPIHSQSPDLQSAKGEGDRSGAGNLETNEVIKNQGPLPPNLKYITTVRPNKVDKSVGPIQLTLLTTGEKGEGHEDSSKEVAQVFSSLSSPKKEDTHHTTSIPPLPSYNIAHITSSRSLVGFDAAEEDPGKNYDQKESLELTSFFPTPPVPKMSVPVKEVLEYPQSPDLLFAKREGVRSETGNLEGNEVSRNPDYVSLRPKYIFNAGQNKVVKPINTPLLLHLRTAKEGEGLEGIFTDVGKVVDLLSSQSKEDMGQSPLISPLPHLRNNVKLTDSNAEIFNVLSQIQKRLAIFPSLDDIRSYRSNEYSSEDDSSRQEFVRVKFSPQVHNATPTKTIKGVLLKSLVPRQYFIIKDIYDILKARAIATSNSEEQEDLFKPDLLQSLRSDERFVAVAPARYPNTNLPRLSFPKREQLIESKLQPGPEKPDFDEFIKPNFSEDQLVNSHREILDQFLNMYLKGQASPAPPEIQDESDEENDSDSSMENLISFLKKGFGGQRESVVKDPEFPPALTRFPLTEENDPMKYFRFVSYR